MTVRLARFGAIWCVPGSRYASTAGALAAIRFARERSLPFLGTCGGFQHTPPEHARSYFGVEHPAHAEILPDALDPVITQLTCSLVGERGAVRFAPGSRIARSRRGLSERSATRQPRPRFFASARIRCIAFVSLSR